METMSAPAPSAAACRAVLPDCSELCVAAATLAPARSSRRTMLLEFLAAAYMRAVRPLLSLALTSFRKRQEGTTGVDWRSRCFQLVHRTTFN